MKKISEKNPASLTGSQINNEITALEVRDCKLTQDMIEAGRGHERPSEYMLKTDPLSQEIKAVWDRLTNLRWEVRYRIGPNAYNLPTQRGSWSKAREKS